MSETNPAGGCYYEPCGGRVFPGQGRFFGYGRCESCAVVVKRAGKRWRRLTEQEWDRPRLLPKGLRDADHWIDQGWKTGPRRRGQ